jgi:hypothetical protein
VLTLFYLACLVSAWLDTLLAMPVIGLLHGTSSHAFPRYVHETITAALLSIKLQTAYVDKILLGIIG